MSLQTLGDLSPKKPFFHTIPLGSLENTVLIEMSSVHEGSMNRDFLLPFFAKLIGPT